MSTIKSSAENLTLNADGANNDIIFQSNGSNIATLDQAGLLTATTFAGSGANLTSIPAANITGTLPAIDGSNLTSVAATDSTKLPLAGGAMTGAITTNSTFDGVDIATRDAILTSTTTTAGAALPKAGGTVTGNLIMTNNINLGDNNRLYVGDGNDLSIYHSGSHSIIAESGTGNLLIQAIDLTLGSTSGESHATFVNNGAASLYYDNSVKLATTSAGVTVTGTISATATATLLVINSAGSTVKTINGIG